MQCCSTFRHVVHTVTIVFSKAQCIVIYPLILRIHCNSVKCQMGLKLVIKKDKPRHMTLYPQVVKKHNPSHISLYP
jgi:hypothetical protein